MPFERDELERLAQATSGKADYRPTSKLSRDELLGLVARSAGPLAEKYVPEPVVALPVAEPAAASPAAEPAAASPVAEPVPRTPDPPPAPSGGQVSPLAVPANQEHAGEHRPREALRALTAPDSLRDDHAAHAHAIVRPIAPRRGVPMVVSVALVVAAVIAVVLFVL